MPTNTPTAPLDDFPTTCSLDELHGLASMLSVPVVADEQELRRAVLTAWRDPAAIDRAVPDNRPKGPILGGAILGTAIIGSAKVGG